MIIKEITFPSGRTVTQLQPDLGYKYITNNEVWSNLVILGYKDKIENWHDTNEEPPIEENDIPIEEEEDEYEEN